MKRIILMLTVAAMMVAALAITSTGAFAASSSQRDCEAGGGTYVKDGSTATCVYPEVTTSGKNPKFEQTSQTTDTGQGNLGNKSDSNTTTTCSSPCPPGQFK